MPNTIDHLVAVGKALFGDRWQTDLSKSLKLSDPRRIRQWINKERKIPAGIWKDLEQLLRERKIEIDEVLSTLEKN